MILYFDDLRVILVLFFIYLLLCLFFKIKFKKNNMFLLFFSIMFVYLCNVIRLTQFPVYALESMREVFDGQNVWREINVVPFRTITSDFSMASALNILMTMPLGFGLPFLMKCSLKKIAFIGAGTGFFCELGQLLVALHVGFTFRFVDIDDIILNMTGAILGYLIYVYVFKPLFKYAINKFSVELNSLLNYIDQVCIRN